MKILDGKAFLDATWADLVLLNYAIPPERVAPHLPAGCEVDVELDDGAPGIGAEPRTYASLVLFEFFDTRAFGIAWPWHRCFSEINLRLYVIFPDPETGERKRGVVFVKELVPRRAIAWTARFFYREPYVALPIRRRVEAAAMEGEAARRLEYAFGRGGVHRVAVRSPDSWAVPEPGSHAERIVEHYWGYTRLDARRTSEYRVVHPSWHTSPAELEELQVDFDRLYGREWAFLAGRAPDSVFVAEGSAVQVLERRVYDFGSGR
ncbi:MAG: DUF2071 domain-containing protein [Holophagales bacterium]|nr:DUF2071 domain-containing protein [Holophagales bacterium]